MRFLHRSHFCTKCEKRVYFLRFTTRKFIDEEHKCPLCKSGLQSFWEDLKFRYIIPVIVGVSFLAGAVIYDIFRFSRNAHEGVDIFISILNVVIASVLAIYGNKYRPRKIPPSTENQIDNGLQNFRKQSLYVVLITLLSFGVVFLFDFIIFLIWKGIELAVQ